MKKRTIILIVSAVLLLALATTGFVLYKNGIIFPKAATVEQETTNTPTSDTTTITYKGQEHISALLLLQAAAKTEISGTGENAFVTSINGITADSAKKQFWSFEVNGKAATVGAGSYITTDDDTITWKLSTY